MDKATEFRKLDALSKLLFGRSGSAPRRAAVSAAYQPSSEAAVRERLYGRWRRRAY